MRWITRGRASSRGGGDHPAHWRVMHGHQMNVAPTPTSEKAHTLTMLCTVSVKLANHYTLYLTLALTRRSAKRRCVIPLAWCTHHRPPWVDTGSGGAVSVTRGNVFQIVICCVQLLMLAYCQCESKGSRRVLQEAVPHKPKGKILKLLILHHKPISEAFYPQGVREGCFLARS